MGFWKHRAGGARPARARRPRRARVTAGELLAAAQPARARAAGARAASRATRRDGAAERRRGVRALPRGAAGRPVPHADQPPPRRPRDRLHRRGLRGQGVRRRTSASPTRAAAAATRSASPPSAASRSATIAGLPRLRRADRRPARRRCPTDRTAGAAMHYTSGTTGKPKGVRRTLPGVDPDDAGASFDGFLLLFGIQPVRRQRPPRAARRSTTPRCSCSPATSLHIGPHASCSWTSGRPRRCSQLIEQYKVTHTPHGADAVPPPARAARRRAGASTTCRRCAT